MISQSTIAIVIVVIIAIMFATEILPLAVTAIIGMLAMGFTGVLTWPQAFSGFTSSSVLMLIGIGIMGASFFTTGVSSKIGDVLYKVAGKSEATFTRVLVIVTTFLSVFFNATTVTALMMPIIDSVSVRSNGMITRRRNYMPMAVASVYGATLTAFSATSNVTASGLLSSSDFGRGFTPFEPMFLMLPFVVLYIIFICTVGCSYATKVLDNVVEAPIEGLFDKEDEKAATFSLPKAIIFGLIIVGMILAIILTDVNFSALFFLVGLLLILTKCIDAHLAFKSVNWEVFLLIACAIGFANGIQVSGAGEILANGVIKISGPLASSPFAMCVVMMTFVTILSNFMSNNSAVVIVMPIALSLAAALNTGVLPYALAIAVGSNLSIATPVATPSTALIYKLGYRMPHYFKYGGLMNLAALVVCSISLKIFFF